MLYLRRHKRGWAWLAVLALLVHAVALSAAAPVQRADTGLGGSLVICTANGAEVAPGDGPSDGPPASGHCPACVPPAHFALAAGRTPEPIAFPVLSAPRPVAAGTVTLALHLVLGGVHSRAPPAHAA
jgi:hypothetical protein